MGLKAVRGRSRPRVGLVLGAGGVLGAAWMTGALPALQERLPCPLGEADLISGTSAGSVIAAALRCGISLDEMIAHQRGEAVGPLADSAVDQLTGGPWPPAPQLRLGSARLMLAMLLTPHRVHPTVGASAWLPLGRGNHAALRDMVHALHRAGRPLAAAVQVLLAQLLPARPDLLEFLALRRWHGSPPCVMAAGVVVRWRPLRPG